MITEKGHLMQTDLDKRFDDPRPTFRIGNTNSRIRFPLDPATFVTRWSEEGPTHHCALGVGDQAEVLLKVGHLLDVTSVRV